VTIEHAAPLYEDLRSQAVKILCCDLIHGDLSPYNVLAGRDGPVVIDFPQVIGASHNSQAERFFQRDLDNLRRFFEPIDPSLRARAGDAREIWRAYERRELTPDFVPTGRQVEGPRHGRQEHGRPEQARPKESRPPVGRPEHGRSPSGPPPQGPRPEHRDRQDRQDRREPRGGRERQDRRDPREQASPAKLPLGAGHASAPAHVAHPTHPPHGSPPPATGRHGARPGQRQGGSPGQRQGPPPGQRQGQPHPPRDRGQPEVVRVARPVAPPARGPAAPQPPRQPGAPRPEGQGRRRGRGGRRR
jgi:RIO kinase 1